MKNVAHIQVITLNIHVILRKANKGRDLPVVPGTEY